MCTSGVWVQESANLPAGQGGQLVSATVVSATEAWAVGNWRAGTSGGSLIEQWNGHAWSIFGNHSPNQVSLFGVTSFGSSQAIAVGETGGTKAVVTVWNGIKWTLTVFAHTTGSTHDSLADVSESSASDIWAAGQYVTSGPLASHILLDHWNGSAWTRFTLPGNTTNDQASGIVDLAPGDVWLLGQDVNGGSHLWHFTGSSWAVSTTVPAPPMGTGPGFAGKSDNDLWSITFDAAHSSEITLHWNGSSWATVGSSDAFAGIGEGVRTFTVGNNGLASSDVVIAKNGVLQHVPVISGSLGGVGIGSGLVFAVGEDDDSSPVPLILLSCD